MSNPKPASTPRPGQDLALLLLAAGAAATDAIHAGVVAAGFTDVRPTHGFAFVRLSPNGATVGELAEHLGVTKQAASQLVDELVRKGYAERNAHPDDARARLITLTAKGWACTRAADAAAAEFADQWASVLGDSTVAQLRNVLTRVVAPGRVRPAVW
ncbi:MarR family winged helix-turn-helix transcriptional regulator [Nocardia pseudovaccinii]|uniref:MarR family winged helix-turn-helix transcriptional regulator n=1 Tax=Nocardia pseudovaccinii TaxID=189540 RepID=UPI0007A4CAD7|nr:MarR family winged helix-turn-helix transcriptional regulator [Nocardia pseudovaccinii]